MNFDNIAIVLNEGVIYKQSNYFNIWHYHDILVQGPSRIVRSVMCVFVYVTCVFVYVTLTSTSQWSSSFAESQLG